MRRTISSKSYFLIQFFSLALIMIAVFLLNFFFDLYELNTSWFRTQRPDIRSFKVVLYDHNFSTSKYNLVLLGSSVSYGTNVTFSDYQGFNYATNSGDPLDFLIITRVLIESEEKPDIIVIPLDFFIYNKNDIGLGKYQGFMSSKKSSNAAKEVLLSHKDIGKNDFKKVITRYFSSGTLTNTVIDLMYAKPFEALFDSNGVDTREYSQNDQEKSIKLINRHVQDNGSYKNFEIDMQLMKALEETVSLAKDNNIRVILFCNPINNITLSYIDNNASDEYKQWRAGIGQISQKFSVPLFDYTSASCEDYARFKDSVHIHKDFQSELLIRAMNDYRNQGW